LVLPLVIDYCNIITNGNTNSYDANTISMTSYYY